MFSIVVGEFTVLCHEGGLPALYLEYAEHAQLLDEFDLDRSVDTSCVIAVGREFAWPILVVRQNCTHPGVFAPTALLVPDTQLLFLGVGERLLAYDLAVPAKLWEDSTDCGCLGWARRGEFILMAGELELAAWDVHGSKRWTTFVEPPWDYRVVDGVVHLDVMGQLTSFPLEAGPA